MRSLLMLLLLLPALPGFAQWNNSASANNPIVTTVNTDNYPFTVPDGAGGVIVFFEKSDGISTDLYAQKINVDGTIAWGNTASPVLICNAIDYQIEIRAIPDGSGGSFLCWEDYRHDPDWGEIYVQHINSAGTSLWTTNGVRITSTPGRQEFLPFLCSDGAGGVIVAWGWDNLLDNLQVNAQRLDAAGSALWTANGVQVSPAPGFRVAQSIVPDGSNGAIISFTDTRNDPNGLSYTLVTTSDLVNTDVYAQKLSGSGVRLWGDNALPVCTAAGNQENFYLNAAVPDGAGGIVIVYDDGRNDVPDVNGNPTNLDIFAQRLNSSGVPQWAVNGVPFTTLANNQYFSALVADGANGFVACWNDESAGSVYSQRLNPSGTAMWTAGGVIVSPIAYPSYDPVLVADGSGNYVYCYTATNANTLEAQKLNSSGVLQWGNSGIVVCNANNALPIQQKMVLSDNGAVIVAWEDGRNASLDIYGSKILTTGILAGVGSFITIAAGDWNNPAIWQGGIVPSASSQVTVRHAVTVTTNASCYSVLLEQPGGNLTVNAGVTLAVTH